MAVRAWLHKGYRGHYGDMSAGDVIVKVVPRISKGKGAGDVTCGGEKCSLSVTCQ